MHLDAIVSQGVTALVVGSEPLRCGMDQAGWQERLSMEDSAAFKLPPQFFGRHTMRIPIVRL